MPEPVTYQSSGVNIDEAQRALRSVTDEIQSTYDGRVMSGVGGFGGLFQAIFPGYEQPILVSSIDGVGTKTKVAAQMGMFKGLGHDIVNHCVNDILCQGAAPLFFLDYFGTSRLSGLQFEEVVSGIAEACRAVGASLIGGETAEMPGVYLDEEIDLVGTIVGVVEQERKLPRGKSRPGDAIIGLASSGLHTNGYSLARRTLLELGNLSVRDNIEGLELTLGEELLRPHRCYFPTVYPLLQEDDSIHAIAHITGGGLYDNIPRILSSDSRAMIERGSWEIPLLFRLIQIYGSVPDVEMFRSTNMGIGMVLIAERAAAPSLIERLNAAGETAMLIGEITPGTTTSPSFKMADKHSVEYELLCTCPDTGARRGRLHTPHGVIETPTFMPVGTQATVKTVGAEDLEALGFRLILSNTYHLGLRPGAPLIERLGGLHKFMSWKGAILTDSGGYQVMSLSNQRTLSDEGVKFKSHIDGTEFFMSPESSIEIQGKLGVDISMALDVCPPFPCTREEAVEAMERTHAWAPRNLAAAKKGQAVFGIVQGGIHMDLREQSVAALTKLPFAGFAIGGVSVGEPTEMQRPVVKAVAPLLPSNMARYLMGVGHPQDIIHGVASGIDMFDCVLPTRMARHHCLYTMQGRKNIGGAKFSEDDGPLDANLSIPSTDRYSAAYLRHLFKVKEPLGPRIATLHNLAFYGRLMERIRQAIETKTWSELVAEYQFA